MMSYESFKKEYLRNKYNTNNEEKIKESYKRYSKRYQIVERTLNIKKV